MAFQDDYMFLGHLRTEIGGTPGASKINVANPRSMSVTGRIWGRLNLGALNDDQFPLPIGNLLVIGDDQSPYHGWFIAVHQAAPDTKAPVVDTVIPNNAATAVSTKSRIGVTFSDNIELATVNAASFIVRPVGGQPLPGKWGARMGVLNFDPTRISSRAPPTRWCCRAAASRISSATRLLPNSSRHSRPTEPERLGLQPQVVIGRPSRWRASRCAATPALALTLEVTHAGPSVVGEAHAFQATVTGANGAVTYEWKFGDADDFHAGGAASPTPSRRRASTTST